jgi:HEAT repeat protein
MTPPSATAPHIPLLGPLLLLAAVGAVALAAWYAARREREGRRDDQAAFRQALRDFLARRGAAADLAERGARLDPALFWTVLESRTFQAPMPTRLSRALARCPQVAAERRALRDDSPWRRDLAARRLGLVRTRWTRRALRRALVRGPEMVTQSAALALARQRDAATLRWLLAHPQAIARRTPRARLALLRAFGPGAHGFLLDALERGASDARLERALIEVLGLGGCSAAAAAIALRLGHVETDVRVAAARALGILRDTPHVGELCDALRDPEWPVRAQAARSLGRLRAPQAVRDLGARLEDRAWWVRHHAAYALAALGRPGRDELERIRVASSDRYAREMADEALRAG